jgi:uncharacterized protein (TIGR03000 family)
MYSAVLLAAMTACESAPKWGHDHKVPHHSYGPCYGACYGYGYTGWVGSPNGWYGPDPGPHAVLPVGGWFGNGHGGHGHGPGVVHANGCWGLPYGGYWAGYGHGGPGYWGACGGYASGAFGLHPPGASGPPAERKPEDRDRLEDRDKDKDKDKNKDKDKDIEDKDRTRAQLIFELPPGARLFVDDQPVADADTRRNFRTPALRPGERYYYELRAEVVRDGKTVVQSKRVTLSAGDTIKADFSGLGRPAGVASAGAR